MGHMTKPAWFESSTGSLFVWRESIFNKKSFGFIKIFMKMYCIVEWILEGLFGIISITTIVKPRKEINDYTEGENVEAKFKGKSYPARIIKISGMCSLNLLFFS